MKLSSVANLLPAPNPRSFATRLLGGACLAAFALSCTPQARTQPSAPRAKDSRGTHPEPPPAAKVSALAPPRVASFDWASLLAEPMRLIREHRGSPPGVAVHQALAEDQSMGATARVDPSSCLVVVARGTSTVDDLDIILWDREGTIVGQDTRVSRTPAVVACPPHPTKLYIQAALSSGFGLVALTAHTVDQAHARDLARQLGAILTGKKFRFLHQPRKGPMDTLLAKLRERHAAMGGVWTDVRRTRLAVSPFAPSYTSAKVDGHTCLDVYVSPDEGVHNLQVTATDGAGRYLARARKIGTERALLLCGQHAEQITIEVRSHVGQGGATVVFSRSDPGTWSELLRSPDATWWGPVLPLDKARTRLKTKLRALGYGASDKRIQTRIRPESTVETKLPVTPGCARIDMLTAAPAGGVDAIVWDEKDRLVGKRTAGWHGAMFVCSPKPRSVTLALTGRGSAGQFEASVHRLGLTDTGTLASHPRAAFRLLDLIDQFAPRQLVTPEGLVVKELQLSDTQRKNIPVGRLERSRCRTYVLASEGTARGLVLSLYDTHDIFVGIGQGDRAAHLKVCRTSQSVPGYIRIRSELGKGPGLLASFPSSP